MLIVNDRGWCTPVALIERTAEMFGGGFFGGPGWGGPGLGGPVCGPGFDGPDMGFGGPSFGGPDFVQGSGMPLKPAVVGTAAMLLDGPADAAQVVRRVSEKTEGALVPPQEMAELAIGLLAGRGIITVDDGMATLTELGKNLLAWRGISSDTARAFLARASQFSDAFKIRKELFRVAGLARTIVWTGSDEQKQKLADVSAKVLEAVTAAQNSLHAALIDS